MIPLQVRAAVAAAMKGSAALRLPLLAGALGETTNDEAAMLAAIHIYPGARAEMRARRRDAILQRTIER